MSNRLVTLLIGVGLGAAGALFLVGVEAGGPGGRGPVSSADGMGRDDLLARVDGEGITRGEVRALQESEHLQLDRSRRDLYEEGVRRAIQDRLVQLAAEDRGLTPEELVQSEVETRIGDPTPGEIDRFYAENRGRLQGTREQLEDPIRQFLRRQSAQAEFEALLSRLEEEYPVERYLEPFRFEVEAEGFPSKGPDDAPVTIVEFSDFECPFCMRVVPTLDRVVERYGDEVRLVFRQFPLTSIHPNARRAAEGSLCAADQGQFWAFHDALFREAGGLDEGSLERTAADVGLDPEAFSRCLESGEHADAVDADLAAGRRLGITGTPALFINGRLLSGAQPYEVIAGVVEDELRRGS